MTEYEYCENKANAFLNNVFTKELIQTNLTFVRERASVLSQYSLIRGVGGCNPNEDNLGKYIRYIDKWLQKSTDDIIQRDFEDVKNIQ